MMGWFHYISRCNGLKFIKAFIIYWQVCQSHKSYVFFGPEISVKFGYWQMWFWKKNMLHVMSCELGSWPLFCILSVCSIFIYSKAHWLYVRWQAIWETSVPSVCSFTQESLENVSTSWLVFSRIVKFPDFYAWYRVDSLQCRRFWIHCTLNKWKMDLSVTII